MTLLPEECSEHADSIFLGDAETVWTQVIDDVQNGRVGAISKRPPTGQIFFMNYIVIPMFEDVAGILPALHPLVTQCEGNRAYWLRHQKQQEAAAAAQQANDPTADVV